VAHVRLTEQAQNELEAILDYYERVGAADFAEVFEEKIIEKMRSLEQFPRMGRAVPEIDDEAIREVFYRDYRIV
jgi:plasmid stabilization system protein ParE